MAYDEKLPIDAPDHGDRLVSRTVACVAGLVLDGNAGFEGELKAHLLAIATNADRAKLIAALADALASPKAKFANQRRRLLDIFILHIEAEISNQETRADEHEELKSGLWNYLTGTSLALGLGIFAAYFWMTAVAPLAPFLGLGLLVISGFGLRGRRNAARKQTEAKAIASGLKSLKKALERRL